MASVIYCKCYLWQIYYGKCNYGKSIMANETEPFYSSSLYKNKCDAMNETITQLFLQIILFSFKYFALSSGDHLRKKFQKFFYKKFFLLFNLQDYNYKFFKVVKNKIKDFVFSQLSLYISSYDKNISKFNSKTLTKYCFEVYGIFLIPFKCLKTSKTNQAMFHIYHIKFK